MSNFSVFPEQWNFIVQHATKAEQFVYDDPKICVWSCRNNLEAWVDWIYENEPGLELPYDKSLYGMMSHPDFKNLIDPTVQQQMHAIRMTGNDGAHGTRVALDDAMHILKLTYGLNGYLINLYAEDYLVFPAFDEDEIPPAAKVRENQMAEIIRKLQKELDREKELHKQSKEQQARMESFRRASEAEIPKDPDETKTRELYIDSYLREAGWVFDDSCTKEYEVSGMPSPSGKGYADYVLWGKDGKPLAVVEAKRTRQKVAAGRHQALLYAEALEKRYRQKPVVFLSNGYEIYLDDYEGPLRKVFGFYSPDELQRNIDRRNTRLPLTEMEINNDITDRYYQKDAIRAVGEHIENHHRGALLVMATGTGKTRTAASLVDVFSKANRAKNVLFLADRDALVIQAKNAFNTYLPGYPSVDLRNEKENDGSRIVFSTYQTLLNLIDSAKTEDKRFYTVGHFDLIIFDEIHRSVYNKYKAIFDYFDGYKIGLTATPREDQIHKDTYDLFGLPPGNPTYSYDLDTAVSDGHLVPYKSYSVNTKFRRDGIRYDQLSDEEKLEYEEKFGDPVTGEIPEIMEATLLDKWIYNTNTVDLILEELMTRGIKVEQGSRLGKTIIFTRKSDHAHFIQDRFNANYPQYKGEFLRVIDYRTQYSDDLLSRFKSPDKMPIIACSVDMLDTGIDVPEVVNLVFLKPVYSPIKFWQMIGRGTRLAPDLFGEGKDKEEFLILDFCQNFEFFKENPRQANVAPQESLNSRLFQIRLKVAETLNFEKRQELLDLRNKLLNQLHRQVQNLYNDGKDSFVVRRHLKSIEKFYDFDRWQDLTKDDIRELGTEIAPLVYDDDSDSRAKVFDLMMYDLLLSIYLGLVTQERLVNNLIRIVKSLRKKHSIPMVKSKMDFLETISGYNYWEQAEPISVEHVRKEIRDLIKFLDSETRGFIETNFTDEILEVVESPNVSEPKTFDKTAYRKKVEQFIRENKHHLVIDKLRKNIPVTREELNILENMLIAQGKNVTSESLEEIYGNKPLGEFIRSIVGLSKEAAKEAFSVLIDEASLNSKQITFLNMIIENFVQNGKVTADQLFNPPYTNIDSGGVIKLFGQETAFQIRSILDGINGNVG